MHRCHYLIALLACFLVLACAGGPTPQKSATEPDSTTPNETSEAPAAAAATDTPDAGRAETEAPPEPSPCVDSENAWETEICESRFALGKGDYEVAADLFIQAIQGAIVIDSDDPRTLEIVALSVGIANQIERQAPGLAAVEFLATARRRA
jgi:hypothetical protein